jgi:hypothetical protein
MTFPALGEISCPTEFWVAGASKADVDPSLDRRVLDQPHDL